MDALSRINEDLRKRIEQLEDKKMCPQSRKRAHSSPKKVSEPGIGTGRNKRLATTLSSSFSSPEKTTIMEPPKPQWTQAERPESRQNDERKERMVIPTAHGRVGGV